MTYLHSEGLKQGAWCIVQPLIFCSEMEYRTIKCRILNKSKPSEEGDEGWTLKIINPLAGSNI